MMRVNVVLWLVAIVCGLLVVTVQHRSRQHFIELEREREVQRQLEVEWGQLQLEQSTWATHSRIERLAQQHLAMRVPGVDQLQLLASPKE
jgi:cell division protein FtsL